MTMSQSLRDISYEVVNILGKQCINSHGPIKLFAYRAYTCKSVYIVINYIRVCYDGCEYHGQAHLLVCLQYICGVKTLACEKYFPNLRLNL